MKKLLFILLLFSGIANGQSKLYLRGDSIQMYRDGGNAELILMNSSRTVDRGILTNMGNGRTRFLPIDSFSVGSSLVPLGSGYPLLHEGVGVKGVFAENGLTPDSATSNRINFRLGGALITNTTIAAGARQLAISFDSISNAVHGFRITSTSANSGIKNLFTINYSQSTASNSVARGISIVMNRAGTTTAGTNYGVDVSSVTGGLSNYGLYGVVGHGIGSSNESAGISGTAQNTGTGYVAGYGNGEMLGARFTSVITRATPNGYFGTSIVGVRGAAQFTHTSASTDSIFTAVGGDFTTNITGSGTAIGVQITATNGTLMSSVPKNYGIIVKGATTEKPLSGFLATSNTPNSIVHIGPAAAGYGSLMIEETATVPTSPVDGMMWHYADSLYFRSGSTTYNLTHNVEGGGSGSPQSLQEVIDVNAWFDKSNVINQDGYTLQWNGPNLFKDTTVTQITEASFSSGIDYTVKTPIAMDTVANVQINVVDGLKAEVTNGTQTHSLQVNGNTFLGRGLSNGSASTLWMQPTSGDAQFFLGFTDSLGTLRRAGVRAINHNAVLYSVHDTDSSYVRARGHEGLKLYGSSGGIYELENVPTYDGTGGEAIVMDTDNRLYKTSITGDGTAVVIGSDVSSAASTTAQDITGLSFSVTSGVLYQFEATILYTTTDNTIGASFGVNGPASPTLVSFTTLTPQTATGISQGSGGDYSLRGAANATPAGVATARVFGFIRPSSSGTFQIRFAPETATAGGIVIKAGTNVKYWARN